VERKIKRLNGAEFAIPPSEESDVMLIEVLALSHGSTERSRSVEAKHLCNAINADPSLGQDYKTDSISPLRGFKDFWWIFFYEHPTPTGLKP